VIAALAPGESCILNPLESEDARSARNVYNAFGAQITEEPEMWRIVGTNGRPQAPDNIVDTGNSGTTMRMALGSAALIPKGLTVLTGDDQVRRRPGGPLAQALNALGAQVQSTRGNGCPPWVVGGMLRGGETEMEAVTSQYVSSLLLNAPLAEGDTRLHVPLLNEKPYVVMTLDWLKNQGIAVQYSDDLSEYHIPGGQQYLPVNRPIPGDFSSATFFLAAGALPGNRVACAGLDMNDSQGDKAVVGFIKEMGAVLRCEKDEVTVAAKKLRGCEFDLNATPDALPMMAALACLAEGTTRLVNVPQARLKETDRIRVMRMELEKLGAAIEELEDGMIIQGGVLHEGVVDGHGDHRIIMALATAATAATGPVTIRGTEAVTVTYPEFFRHLQALGGSLSGSGIEAS
jgi:3-phosphoshikimate 1-carboxyvinyltransferase